MDSSPILLVDDDGDDIFFFCRAMKREGLNQAVDFAKDGQQAIDYLSREGEFQHITSKPCLVVLDIKLPLLNGLQVLSWIRAQEEFKKLPVVVWSSSKLPSDLIHAYSRGANSFFVKPSHPADYVLFIRHLKTDFLRGGHGKGRKSGQTSKIPVLNPQGFMPAQSQSSSAAPMP